MRIEVLDVSTAIRTISNANVFINGYITKLAPGGLPEVSVKPREVKSCEGVSWLFAACFILAVLRAQDREARQAA